MKSHTDNQIVVEIKTETLDTPYSDTFVCQEIWVTVAT
jgi:hypothetical protein